MRKYGKVFPTNHEEARTKQVKVFYLKAEAIIWPCLSGMCNFRSTVVPIGRSERETPCDPR